jgi:phosphoglycerate dehydrogenase-like enzyme
MARRRGLFILDEAALSLVYGPDEQRDIAKHVEFVAPPQTKQSIADHPELLRDVEMIFSGWGAPQLNQKFLDAAPKLEVFFYGAGSTGYIITDAVWERDLLLTSANAANAIPVAEYSLATILFSLKHGWALIQKTKQRRTFPARNGAPGAYKATVGLISLGITARTLRKMLHAFDINVLAYDPYVTPDEASKLNVQLTSLDDLFQRSDVVSVHTPLLTETEGMITGAHIESMKQGATFINTARGQIVREAEMIRILSNRPDLQAVLDVTEKEPPDPESPLYTLSNVVLTPHIAGSVGGECLRMGRYMVEELHRYLRGESLRWVVTHDSVTWSTHRPAGFRPVSVKLRRAKVLGPA